MIFVGIAGPSGSGKSTLCNFFIESGCDVYNLDKVAKRFYPDAAEQIKNDLKSFDWQRRGAPQGHEPFLHLKKSSDESMLAPECSIYGTDNYPAFDSPFDL